VAQKNVSQRIAEGIDAVLKTSEQEISSLRKLCQTVCQSKAALLHNIEDQIYDFTALVEKISVDCADCVADESVGECLSDPHKSSS
jgi:hypothetical protein